MAQHRNAALDQEAHGIGHGLAALDLDAGAAGFRHDEGRILERLRRAFLIGTKWHIDNDAGARCAAHRRCAVRDHHLERHRQRAVEAVNHHAERITDQKQVGDRVERARHRRAVRRQRDDRLAAFAPRQFGGCALLAFGGRNAHTNSTRIAIAAFYRSAA